VKIRRRILGLVVTLQGILFLAHLFIYQTWIFSLAHVPGRGFIELLLGILSLTFVPASLLGFRYSNGFVRIFYRIAAIWVGLLSFLAIASACSWLIFAIARVWLAPDFHRIVECAYAAALLASLYGLINASWTRVTRAKVQLPNLPSTWRGRKAALISDLHLGHVRNGNFLRRLVARVVSEQPHAVFIAGDLYDGTAIDAMRAAEPLNQLKAPQGVYFVAGNHEQFGDDSKYLDAVAAAGVRVLNNEKVEVDGLQILGVSYRNAWQRKPFSAILRAIGVDPGRASILLTHAPDHPEIAESAGISLQLSGHTHLGQFIPWSWVAKRIYRQFVYGLSRIGKMQVFTSSGVGTWGPPLRLGSNSEIVVLQFE
jgi:uncharacterized protein